MKTSHLFYFDIETTSKYKDFEDFANNDSRGGELLKYKYLKKGTPDSIDIFYKNTAPLYPEYGQILCLSYGFYSNGILSMASVSNNDNEQELMLKIQKIFQKVDELGLTLCGYNIKGFDIQWVNKKLTMYNLDVPKCLNTFNKKPWEINVIDIMEVWKSTGWESSTFDEVAYSLDIPSPKDGEVNGKTMQEYYWATKNMKHIVEYCERDVKTLSLITEKLFRVL
jgi:3'-5' exonuclease